MSCHITLIDGGVIAYCKYPIMGYGGEISTFKNNRSPRKTRKRRLSVSQPVSDREKQIMSDTKEQS